MKSLLAIAAAALVPRAAHAFEIESPVSEACHEEVTLAAAEAAGFPAFGEAPSPTEDQHRAMDDLVFSLPRADPWSLALFVGVRSNDLGPEAPTALSSLIHYHDDPEKQDEHCIRRPEDDGAAGNASALAACRAFIVGELEAGGLLDESIDLARTELVSTYFNFRGEYELALPAFAYRLGRATHALQDAHTHSMRDAETGAVVHVLNWIEAYGDNEYDEAADGYPHLAGLDTCRDVNAHQQRRIELATAATTTMYRALADPAPDRRARVLAAIDAALVQKPGCDATNDYCNAPELEEPVGPRAFGCAAAGATSGLALLVTLWLPMFVRRRRAAAIVAAVVMLSIVPAVRADDASPWVGEGEPGKLGDVELDATGSRHWHLDARLGGAIDEPAVGGMLGVARTQCAWTFGVLAEWNPWFSFDRVAARPGVINAYAHVAYSWFRGNRLSIATRLEAGTSTMLFELLGIDKYTTGLYVGGALATIRFPLTPGFAMTFDPVHFALPAPRPFGLPFYHKQYRVTVGVELRL